MGKQIIYLFIFIVFLFLNFVETFAMDPNCGQGKQSGSKVFSTTKGKSQVIVAMKRGSEYFRKPIETEEEVVRTDGKIIQVDSDSEDGECLSPTLEDIDQVVKQVLPQEKKKRMNPPDESVKVLKSGKRKHQRSKRKKNKKKSEAEKRRKEQQQKEEQEKKKKKEEHEKRQKETAVFCKAVGYCGKAVVIGGYVHLYSVDQPKECKIEAKTLEHAQVCEDCGKDGSYGLYLCVKEGMRVSPHIEELLKILAENVEKRNEQRTFYKLSGNFKWMDELRCGCLVVEQYQAYIRPWVDEEQWKEQRHRATLFVRGPKSCEDITKWWEELGAECQRVIKDGRGKEEPAAIVKKGSGHEGTFVIISRFRKCDIPKQVPEGWIIIPSGHCFQCGRAGHTERRCPLRRLPCCGLCGQPNHTESVCPWKRTRLMNVVNAVSSLGKARQYIRVQLKGQDLPPNISNVITQLKAQVEKYDKLVKPKKSQAVQVLVKERKGQPSFEEPQATKFKSVQRKLDGFFQVLDSEKKSTRL